MSDDLSDFQFLELVNKNLKDEVILLMDENKDLKDQAAHLSAENKKLQDANNDLVDKVGDLSDKYDDVDRERKRLADLVKQSTVSRLTVQRAHFSEEKTGQIQPGQISNRLSTITAGTSASLNNNVQLPPISTDEKKRPGGKATKNNSRFEEGIYQRGRKLVLPDIENTSGLVPKPPSAVLSRRNKPTQDVVMESSFTPRPPERKAKKSEFVFKRPGSKMAVRRGRGQQDTASNSDSSRSTPVLVPRPPARQAKKGPFVFQPNEKLAVARSKPAPAKKPVIIDRPAPESTEFVFKRKTSPVAAPRSVPNRNA